MTPTPNGAGTPPMSHTPMQQDLDDLSRIEAGGADTDKDKDRIRDISRRYPDNTEVGKRARAVEDSWKPKVKPPSESEVQERIRKQRERSLPPDDDQPRPKRRGI